MGNFYTIAVVVCKWWNQGFKRFIKYLDETAFYWEMAWPSQSKPRKVE